MMRPERCFTMIGTMRLASKNAPVSLISSTRCHTVSSSSVTGTRSLPRGYAALFTSTSIRPKAAMTRSTRSWTDAARLTSPTHVRARRPRSRIC